MVPAGQAGLVVPAACSSGQRPQCAAPARCIGDPPPTTTIPDSLANGGNPTPDSRPNPTNQPLPQNSCADVFGGGLGLADTCRPVSPDQTCWQIGNPHTDRYDHTQARICVHHEGQPSKPETESCTPFNSFDGDTDVLMADGTTKPIRDIQAGDQVLATDPETGETGPRTVTASIVGSGDKQLVDITITTPDGPATLTATGGHPFWDAADRTWTDADQLTSSDRLQTPTGTLLPVTTTRTYQRTDTVHNLTVADLHTYYVLAGATPVLVHNCGGTLLGRARELYSTRKDAKSTVAVAQVRNRNTGEFETWVATEEDILPDEWRGGNAPLRGERYIIGKGHAEATIMNSLGNDWEIIGMASSTRMCPACFAQAERIRLKPSRIGMGTGRSDTGNTVWRVVLRGGD